MTREREPRGRLPIPRRRKKADGTSDSCRCRDVLIDGREVDLGELLAA